MSFGQPIRGRIRYGLHNPLIPEILIDSYPEINQSGSFSLSVLHPSSSIVWSAVSQCFQTRTPKQIISAKFYLAKIFLPTGNAHAVLYAMTGTYGTSGIPTGPALATSDDFDVSTLKTGYNLETFRFRGAQQYQMQPSTYYCIAFENPTSGLVNASNYIVLGLDASAPSHSGNSARFRNGAWAPHSWDAIFYVYGQ